MTRSRRHLPEALLIAGFFLFLLAVTPRGIYPSGDSDIYLFAALTLKQGMLTATGTPMIWFPPAYPTILAALGDHIRMLHAALYGVNMALFCVLLRDAGLHRWAAFCVAVCVGFSPGLIYVHSRILTEPVFLTMTLLALISISRQRFGTAAVFIALSCLQRYPGVVMIGVLAYALLAENLRAAGGGARAAGAVDAAQRTADRRSRPEAGLAPAGHGSLDRLDRHAGVVVSAAPAGRAVADAALVYTALYLAFTLISISFFDHATPLDVRILSPVLLAGWVACVPVLRHSWAINRPMTLLFVLPALFIHVALGMNWALVNTY